MEREREREREKEREEGQRVNYTDRQTDIQNDRQTDRQTEDQTRHNHNTEHTQTDRHIKRYWLVSRLAIDWTKRRPKVVRLYWMAYIRQTKRGDRPVEGAALAGGQSLYPVASTCLHQLLGETHRPLVYGRNGRHWSDHV